jgi:hypothetical protein
MGHGCLIDPKGVPESCTRSPAVVGSSFTGSVNILFSTYSNCTMRNEAHSYVCHQHCFWGA